MNSLTINYTDPADLIKQLRAHLAAFDPQPAEPVDPMAGAGSDDLFAQYKAAEAAGRTFGTFEQWLKDYAELKEAEHTIPLRQDRIDVLRRRLGMPKNGETK
jgi:hypothetical protein